MVVTSDDYLARLPASAAAPGCITTHDAARFVCYMIRHSKAAATMQPNVHDQNPVPAAYTVQRKAAINRDGDCPNTETLQKPHITHCST